MSYIQLNNILFIYPENKTRISFRVNIDSLEIQKGSFFSILGPNGSGKSTLLKLMAGINKPNSGSIKIEGRDIEEIKRNDYSKIISYVPQSVTSTFPYSVYEIVMMGRTPYLNFMGFEKMNDKKIVEEAMEIMELNNIRNKGINEISGGELQRVFIAKALAQQPQIILLDEPNSHLDIQHQVAIFNLLSNLCNEKNITVITVSHDLNMVGLYSKELVFMNNGEIAISGEKQNIFTNENINKIFNVHAEVTFTTDPFKANVLINPQ